MLSTSNTFSLMKFSTELMDDEDEVLSALVDSLSNFLDNIGGN